jgi:chromosome segregation ATPase
MRTLIPNRLPGAILTVNETRRLFSINRNITAAERRVAELTRQLNAIRRQVFGSTPNNFYRIQQEMGNVGYELHEELQPMLEQLRENRANLEQQLHAKYAGNAQVLANGTVLRYTRANKAAEIARFENWARRHARHLLIEKMRRPARRAAAMSALTTPVNIPATAILRMLPYRSIHGNYRPGTTRRATPNVRPRTRRT